MAGQESFQVDGIELGLSKSDFQFVNGFMHVHVVARSAPHAERPDLFEQKYGYVQPGVRVQDISFPTPSCRAMVKFEAHPAGNRSGLWLDGFAGHRQLEGEVRIEDDIFILEGELRRDYGRGAGASILIRTSFQPGPVDPRRFQHTDLAYALTLNPTWVASLSVNASKTPALESLGKLVHLRFLSLYGYDLENAFDEFERFGALRTLVIGGEPLVRLPTSVCSLPMLEELLIDHASLAELPPAIGRLQSLARLSIKDCELAVVPDEIGQLQRLEDVSLNRTKLRHVPVSLLALPRLRRVDLQWNCLESLPELPETRAFESIALKGNAFVRLPASLARVKRVDIEPKMKSLYTDTSYRTLHTQPTDPTLLRADDDPAFVHRFDKLLAEHELVHYRNALLPLARKSVLFETTVPDDYTEIGNTRFGGDPDLPPGFVWPTSSVYGHWMFLAQINLADIAHLQQYLPRAGLLSFLVQDLEYVQKTSILLHSPGSSLRRTSLPEGAVSDTGPLQGFRAVAASGYSLPNVYGIGRRDVPGAELLNELDRDAERADRYQLVCNAFLRERGRGENDRHGINVHVFTQHESPEEQAAQRCGGLPEEWIVLLNLGFDRNTGFCFWDAGTLTFMIHTRDLAAMDFSRVVAFIESS